MSLDGHGAHYGAVTSVGILRWFNPRIGFVLEANYSILDHDGAVHEAGLNVGIAYHL